MKVTVTNGTWTLSTTITRQQLGTAIAAGLGIGLPADAQVRITSSSDGLAVEFFGAVAASGSVSINLPEPAAPVAAVPLAPPAAQAADSTSALPSRA